MAKKKIFKKSKKPTTNQQDDVEDKIFNNAFNVGNTGFDELPDIRVNEEYADKHLNDVYDAEQYHVRTELTKKCEDAFIESQWNGLPRDKKFPKDLMPYIFNDLYKSLDNEGYAAIDIFIAIAEFMGVSYEKVYDSAGIKVKERLIFELNQKYGSLDKKNIDRLF